MNIKQPPDVNKHAVLSFYQGNLSLVIRRFIQLSLEYSPPERISVGAQSSEINNHN